MTTPTVLAAGTWAGDPIHSDISFGVRHVGVELELLRALDGPGVQHLRYRVRSAA